MKKFMSLALIGMLCLTLTACGSKESTNDDTKKSDKTEVKTDISKQYAKIKKDFIAIKKDVTVENIEKVTGIKATTIKDGEEEYGSLSYEYKFDYGYDYEAYITVTYSHNPKSVYDYDTTYVELKCPSELFENSDLDLSSLKKDEFKEMVDRGTKVSAINSAVGGEGFAYKYQTSYKTGKADVTSIVWADKKGNYIKSSLRGGETTELDDKTLSFVSYILKQ